MKPREKVELGESHFFVEVGGGEVGTEGDYPRKRRRGRRGGRWRGVDLEMKDPSARLSKHMRFG